MSNITQKIYQSIHEKDSKSFGELNVVIDDASVFVNGHISSTLENVEEIITETVKELLPNALVFFNLETSKNGLTVRVQDQETNTVSSADENEILDQVSTLFQGSMPLSQIVENTQYKRINHETLDKIRACHDVLGVITPIILDKNLKIIDGSLRLEVARLNGLEQVPVMILNVDGKRADSLRLLLNRSSEFQRWLYEEVDVFVDNIPQIQPLLEPLGFFGNKILPTTFFGNTILNYHIDEYNTQMQLYSQDIGLAEWAEVRRQELFDEENRKKELRNTKRSTDDLVSLFDLSPTESDFIETSEPSKVIRSHVVEMQEVADTITNNYDAVRKAEKEAKGQAWQTSRRSSKEKAADLRREAELNKFDNEGGEDLD